jgi:hypothetical protein
MRHPGATLFPVISKGGLFQQPRLFSPIESYLRSVGNWPRPQKNSPIVGKLTFAGRTKPAIVLRVLTKRSFRNNEDEALQGVDYRGGEAGGKGAIGEGTGL